MIVGTGEKLHQIAGMMCTYFDSFAADPQLKIIADYTELAEDPDAVVDLLLVDLDEEGEEQAAAAYFRKKPTTTIVLVSEGTKCVMCREKYGAVCIRKGDAAERIQSAAAECMEIYKKNQNKIVFRRGTRRTPIPIEEIMYIESTKRTVTLNGDRSKIYTAKISDLEHQLADKGFLKIHKSFLINTAKCSRIRSYVACLDDGTVLPCGRQNYRELLVRFDEMKSTIERL